MRNLLYSRKTPAEIKGIMTDVGGNMRNGKKHKNRTNFANVKTDIENQFDNYSDRFIDHDLEHVNQCLAISEDEKTLSGHCMNQVLNIRQDYGTSSKELTETRR